MVNDPSPGKCYDPAEPPSSPGAPPLVPYGGYIVPVGAPYTSSDPGTLSPAPAPAPTSGADVPESGGDGNMAHTTMVSAIQGVQWHMDRTISVRPTHVALTCKFLNTCSFEK